MDYSVEAIILKSFRLNEADKVLHLYSLEYGPIKAIAKSAYKSKTGSSQNINRCEFLLAKGKSFDVVKEIKVVEDFKKLKSNYQAIGFAFLLVEILNKIGIHDEEYEIPYNAILEKLRALDSVEKIEDQIKTVIEFLWIIIEHLGYRPELDTCGYSKLKRQSGQIPQYFDLTTGSVVSRTALQSSLQNSYQDPSVISINSRVFELLKTLGSFSSIQSLNPNYEDLVAGFKLLNRHLEFNLKEEFKSSKFIETLVA